MAELSGVALSLADLPWWMHYLAIFLGFFTLFMVAGIGVLAWLLPTERYHDTR